MGRQLTYIAAINEAISQEMARDPRVLYFGQNIATTENDEFLRAFGGDRVRVTPISETAEIGMAVGAALAGYRPVVELYMAEFMLVAMDQVVNEAPRFRYVAGNLVLFEDAMTEEIIKSLVARGHQRATEPGASMGGGQAIMIDPASGTLVSSIIGLASAFNLIAVAEGVETEAQLELLRKLKCDHSQGFLHSRPIPAEQLEHMLALQARRPKRRDLN